MRYCNLFFAVLVLLLCAACAKKCDTTLYPETTGKYFQIAFDSTNVVWAKEGSWMQTGNDVVINASGFGSSGFAKISIAYNATDLDSTTIDNASVVKILPGKLTYTSPTNVEITNNAIAYLEIKPGSIKDSRQGKILSIPLYSSAVGKVNLACSFMVCAR
jgi:hypothetical protein